MCLQVILAIAPADIVYCQEALLQLAAFHNEAWPPPELDPVEVHSAVSFKEIVADRLDTAAQRRRNQAQNPTLLDFQVKALSTMIVWVQEGVRVLCLHE